MTADQDEPEPPRAEPTIEVLRDALAMLEEHPPIEVREYGRPAGGEKDCAICSYPLTGAVKPGLEEHKDRLGRTWSRCPGERCTYMVLLERMRAAIGRLEEDES